MRAWELEEIETSERMQRAENVNTELQWRRSSAMMKCRKGERRVHFNVMRCAILARKTVSYHIHKSSRTRCLAQKNTIADHKS